MIPPAGVHADGARGVERAVLVVHGRAGPGSVAALVEHLAASHDVLAPTWPPWLGAPGRHDAPAVAALALALLADLAARDQRGVVVVGVDTGAWVGAWVAVLDARGRVGDLVLIAPTGIFAPTGALKDQARIEGEGALATSCATSRPPPWWSAGPRTRPAPRPTGAPGRTRCPWPVSTWCPAPGIRWPAQNPGRCARPSTRSCASRWG